MAKYNSLWRKILPCLISTALVWTPLPRAQRAEAFPAAIPIVLAEAPEIVVLFTGLAIAVTALCHSVAPEEAFELGLDHVRLHDIHLGQDFRELFASRQGLNPTVCRWPMPPLSPPDQPDLENIAQQILQSPFFLGMGLAFDNLFRSFGVVADTIMMTPEGQEAAAKQLWANPLFRVRFEALTQAYESAISDAVPATLGDVLSGWKTRIGNCMKDPNAWKFLIAAMGWLGLPIGGTLLALAHLEIFRKQEDPGWLILGLLFSVSAVILPLRAELQTENGPVSNFRRGLKRAQECLDPNLGANAINRSDEWFLERGAQGFVYLVLSATSLIIAQRLPSSETE